MTCPVRILPYIVFFIVDIGGSDPLIIIRPPAIAQAKAVVGGVVSVVHMGDTYGHPCAAKAEILTDPNQVSGIIVDIACAGIACGYLVIIPIGLQTVVVTENNGQAGQPAGSAVVRGRKLLPGIGV